MLGSCDLNQRKLGIDITRGSTLQLQGGAGKTIARRFDVGAIGYALWQLTDDRGADLPAILRGARDVAYGIGGEIDVNVPEARARVTLRYSHDLAVRSRPRGQLLLLGLTFTAWRH